VSSWRPSRHVKKRDSFCADGLHLIVVDTLLPTLTRSNTRRQPQEEKILGCMTQLLTNVLMGAVTEKEAGQRAALEVMEKGRRAAAMLEQQGATGGRVDVWAETELPLQEGEGGAEAKTMSAEEIEELRAMVARGEQAKREARERGLFTAQEHAPLALPQVRPGRYAAAKGVEVRPLPDATAAALASLETVLLMKDLGGEIYSFLDADDMSRLRWASRSTWHAYDKVCVWVWVCGCVEGLELFWLDGFP
jgi:hypothetical protein